MSWQSQKTLQRLSFIVVQVNVETWKLVVACVMTCTTGVAVREKRRMQQLYESFLGAPSATSYLAVRDALMRQGLPQMPLALASFAQIVNSPRHEDALMLRDQMRNEWLLCPRFHYLIGQLAIATNDEEQVELSLFECQCCLNGLLATGDGSCESPYQTTYFTDSEDLTRRLGYKILARHTVDRAGMLFELVSCSHGQELWMATWQHATSSTLHKPSSRRAQAPLR